MLAGLGYPKEVEPLDIDSYNEDLDADQRGRIEACLFRRIPVLREMEYHHGYASHLYDHGRLAPRSWDRSPDIEG